MADYVYTHHAHPDILRMIPDDGQVIGSVGCGYAGVEAELVRRGRQVHGVDISPEAVAHARTVLSSATQIAPGDPLPFAPASLDGLILADVIEHIPAAWVALKSFAAAVRPGGWVVISVPNMRSLHVFKTFFLGGDWPEDAVGIFDRTHLQVMSRARLDRWCRAAGLEPERWFDRYDPMRPRRGPMLDRLTLKLFHPFFMHQIQVRCRVRGAAASTP